MRKSLLALLLLLAGLAGDVYAQTGNASLGGIVQDPSKALIPGVTLTAKNVDTGVTAETESVLKESSASVSAVLTQAKIESMPVVGNNVLDMLTALPTTTKNLERNFQGQLRLNF